MTEKLLPCPFCCGDAEFERLGDRVVRAPSSLAHLAARGLRTVKSGTTAEVGTLAIFRQRPDVEGWQPIETAPTDGRDLIMTSTDWNGDIMVGSFAFGKWRENPSPEGCSFTPTHWMPIPPMPAATTEGQSPAQKKEPRHGPATGEAKPDNASETAGGRAPSSGAATDE